MDISLINSFMASVKDLDSHCIDETLRSYERELKLQGLATEANLCALMSRCWNFSCLFRNKQTKYEQLVRKYFNVADFLPYIEMIPLMELGKITAFLSDMAWIVSENAICPKDRAGLGNFAIRAYQTVDISADTWYLYGENAWYRCLTLVCRLHPRDENEKAELCKRIVESLKTVDSTDFAFSCYLSQLLRFFRWGDTQSSEISHCLEKIALELETEGNHYNAANCYDEAKMWHKRKEDKPKWVELTMKWVYAKEKSFARTSTFAIPREMKNIIAMLRSIPQEFRRQYDVDNNMHRLEIEMWKVRARCKELSYPIYEELQCLELPKIINDYLLGMDTEQVANSLAEVDVLLNENIVNDAASVLLETTLCYKGAVCFVMHDDLRELISTDGKGEGMNEAKLNERMLKIAKSDITHTYVREAVSGYILPMLDALRNKNALPESWFVDVVGRAGVVPDNHKRLVAKGLYFGYSGDMESSMHILAPQLENMIRSILITVGASCVHKNKDDVEEYDGMNSLAYRDELKKHFGEQNAYVLRMVFCDPLGANLRNEVAHGIVGDASHANPWFTYAWWFIFRLVYMSGQGNNYIL